MLSLAACTTTDRTNGEQIANKDVHSAPRLHAGSWRLQRLWQTSLLLAIRVRRQLPPNFFERNAQKSIDLLKFGSQVVPVADVAAQLFEHLADMFHTTSSDSFAMKARQTRSIVIRVLWGHGSVAVRPLEFLEDSKKLTFATGHGRESIGDALLRVLVSCSFEHLMPVGEPYRAV